MGLSSSQLVPTSWLMGEGALQSDFAGCGLAARDSNETQHTTCTSRMILISFPSPRSNLASTRLFLSQPSYLHYSSASAGDCSPQRLFQLTQAATIPSFDAQLPILWPRSLQGRTPRTTTTLQKCTDSSISGTSRQDVFIRRRRATRSQERR